MCVYGQRPVSFSANKGKVSIHSTNKGTHVFLEKQGQVPARDVTQDAIKRPHISHPPLLGAGPGTHSRKVLARVIGCQETRAAEGLLPCNHHLKALSIHIIRHHLINNFWVKYMNVKITGKLKSTWYDTDRAISGHMLVEGWLTLGGS